MRSLFDVNALLAVFDREHAFHVAVRAWWHANVDHGWATCPLSQNGFVRIMSQRSYSNPLPLQQANNLLRAGVSDRAHAFWPDDISITDPAVFDHTRILGHRQLTDIYLLALAVKNGGRLVTFDRTIPISAVRGATPDNLVVV